MVKEICLHKMSKNIDSTDLIKILWYHCPEQLKIMEKCHGFRILIFKIIYITSCVNFLIGISGLYSCFWKTSLVWICFLTAQWLMLKI